MFAVDHDWNATSAGLTQMNVAGNWLPASVPASGDVLVFPAGASFSKQVNNNIGPFTLATPLSPGASPSLTIADAYTLTGSNFIVPAGGATLSFGSTNALVNVGAVTLNGNLSVSSGAINTIQSALPDGTTQGSLTLTAGVLKLSGGCTYSGATILETSTTLMAGAGGALSPNSNITLGSGATLNLNNFNNTVGNISGDSGIVNLGAATLTVKNTGVNSFAGLIEGTNGGFTLGTGSTGSLTLSGNNTYSSTSSPGTTTVNAATLIAGSTNAFGIQSNMVIASGATLNLNGFSMAFNELNGAGTLTLGSANLTINANSSFTGNIGGSGSLTIDSGIVSLLGTNGYTGTTTLVSGASLTVNSLGASTGLTFQSGLTTLVANNTFTFTHPVSITGTPAIDTNGFNITLSNNITGGGSLTKNGAGILTLGGTNGYTGATTINEGTVTAGSTSAFGTNSDVTIWPDAVLNLANSSNSIGSLSGMVDSEVTLGSGTLTVTNGSVDAAFYGIISGTGDVAVSGGTLTLMQSNTYTGTTTVTGGSTLNTIDLGDSTSLDFTGGGGNIEFGSSFTSSADLAINGPATLGTNTYDVVIQGTISGDSSVFNKIGLGTLTLTGTNNKSGQITIEGGVLNLNQSSLGATTSIVFDTFGGTLQAGGNLTIGSGIPITLAQGSPGMGIT